tara:strand:+ start:38 stop:310 length:273 start_codon:yes stop_codon:yes gene_type:complete
VVGGWGVGTPAPLFTLNPRYNESQVSGLVRVASNAKPDSRYNESQVSGLGRVARENKPDFYFSIGKRKHEVQKKCKVLWFKIHTRVSVCS